MFEMQLHNLQPRLLRRFLASGFCSLLLSASFLWAQPATRNYPLVLGASGGIALGIGSAALFDGYRQLTGLRNNDFDVPLSAQAVALIELGGIRIGASANYFRTQSLERGSPPQSPQRVLEERLQLEMLPLMLAVEWEPWRDQFRSYLSAAAGAAIARFQWYERNWNTGQLESDMLRADARHTVPALRIGIGTHLLFDATQQTAIHGALTVEMRYTYSPVQTAAFDSFASGTTPAAEQWKRPIHVGGSALELLLGVRFQLGRSP
jgi:hypothetical protein